MLRIAVARGRRAASVSWQTGIYLSPLQSSSSSSSSRALYETSSFETRRGPNGNGKPPPLLSKSDQQREKNEKTGRRGIGVDRRRVPPARDWSIPKHRVEPAKEKPRYNSELQKQMKPSISKPVKVKQIQREEVVIPLPPFITVSDLARVLSVKLRVLQAAMTKAGHTDTRPDLLLSYSDAEILLLDSNATAIPLSTSSNSFDIYPRPPSAPSELEERPPVIAIMGHVDHGKTTLLDKLRSASVAAGEAGGITQHVGAFSVQVKASSADSPTRAITFLDTPGHAAFTKMRGRGAKVTDIVVLVVAADDGVMPQTKEVLQLVKDVQDEEGTGSSGGLQLIVALSKIDKAEANVDKVKSQLFSEGVQVEDFGGDIPCVEISGRTGQGLDKLQETLLAISELNELKAEKTGPAEGYVIESRIDKGFGNTAIVLVKRGRMQVGDYIVAGLGWCKVRKLMDSSGKVSVKQAVPGDAVLVTGWRNLPGAGDLFLGVEDAKTGEKAEELVKKCLDSRKRVEERRKLGQDVTMINESRRVEAEEKDRLAKKEFEDKKRNRLERMERSDSGLTEEELKIIFESKVDDNLVDKKEDKQVDMKELRLVVRADYSGTVEAVVGAIQDIGNSEVKVKIVSTGVGEPSDSDVAMAQAVEGQILGFNVKASRSLQNLSQKLQPRVKIHCDDVIYRLMTYVTEQCVALLPPLIQPRIQGEATIQEVFKINVKGRVFRNVAGCRITNGTISKNQLVRIMRADSKKDGERQIIYEGKLDSLKQVKREVDEMKRGTECGMAFVNFQEFQKGDFVQCYYNEEIPRTL